MLPFHKRLEVFKYACFAILISVHSDETKNDCTFRLQRDAGRNAGVAHLAALFRIVQAVQPMDLCSTVNLACGRVFPAHFNREAMVGESALRQAVASVSGTLICISISLNADTIMFS